MVNNHYTKKNSQNFINISIKPSELHSDRVFSEEKYFYKTKQKSVGNGSAGRWVWMLAE